MSRRWLSSTLLLLAAVQGLPASQEIVGEVRVTALSPQLVRVEVKGPKGFEDRETFHVVNRTNGFGDGTNLVRREEGGTVKLSTSDMQVEIPAAAKALEGIKIVAPDGTILMENLSALSNSVWLPKPGEMPKAWGFADNPRIVPPAAADWAAQGQAWDTANDAPDVYVFAHKDYHSLRADFTKLTGPVELPPFYALGFMDSRWFPYTEDSAIERIQEYRRRGFPLEVLVVDTDWRIGASHGYAPNPQYFPDLPRFFKRAHHLGVKVMFNDHPEPQAQSAFDPKELRYRWNGLAPILQQGLDVWWYDRNWHVGLVPPLPGLRKEVWGMRLYRDITAAAKPGLRPMIMANVDGIDNGYRNRPPNVAAHRYPIQWSGDTHGSWEFLRRGVENAVYSGVHAVNPWIGEDLGGHMGTPSPELYIRFFQYGALSPTMRVHCTRGLTREPWAFGAEAEGISREYTLLRYRMLPLLYSLAAAGVPIVQRADLQYPRFAEAAADDQYLIGRDLLVAPVIESALENPVGAGSFPGGLKAEYFANEKLEGAPVVTRTEETLRHSWGSNSPAEGVPADRFTARWTGRMQVPAGGDYKLAVVSDDGVRVWLDGKLVLDKWVPQDSVRSDVPLVLKAGASHDLRVEYLEITGQARLELHWLKQGSKLLSKRPVWIPPGTWIDLWSGRNHEGPGVLELTADLRQTPMLVRRGGIIPLAPEMKFSGEKRWDPVTLEIWPGGEGTASLYEDDGLTEAYQSGESRRMPLVSDHQGRRFSLKIGPNQGVLEDTPREWVLRVRSSRLPRSVVLDGRAVRDVKMIRRNPGAMVLAGKGGASDGDVVEIRLKGFSAEAERNVEITFE